MSKPTDPVPHTVRRPISYAEEWMRKALHVLALILPLSVLWIGKPVALWILAPAALFAVACDVARVRSTGFARFINRGFGFMMRPEEIPPVGGPVVLNGATWVLISCVVAIAVFPVRVAVAALCMFMIGDAVAALVGRRFGRTRLVGGNKSLEGSAAFVLAALPIAFFLPGPSFWIGAGGALGAAIGEALPGPFNDNLLSPLLAGTAMLGVRLLLPI